MLRQLLKLLVNFKLMSRGPLLPPHCRWMVHYEEVEVVSMMKRMMMSLLGMMIKIKMIYLFG